MESRPQQPIKNKQLILMTDASFTAAGYAIIIENDPNQKLRSRRKTYAAIVFGSKAFNPTQLKFSIYAKEFLANFLRSPNSDSSSGEVFFQLSLSQITVQ